MSCGLISSATSFCCTSPQKAPGVAVLAIATLSVGIIAVNAAVFAVIHAALFKGFVYVVLGCGIPAVRAMRVDAAIALRGE
jgi:predicted membrane channel-forming protein YqfA (hemolysin III family)